MKRDPEKKTAKLCYLKITTDVTGQKEPKKPVNFLEVSENNKYCFTVARIRDRYR